MNLKSIISLSRVLLLISFLLHVGFANSISYEYFTESSGAFVVDQVCYKKSGGNAYVTYYGVRKYYWYYDGHKYGPVFDGYRGGYIGTSADVTIPSSVVISSSTYDVTSIGDYAFEEEGFSSIILPNGIITIGKEAFNYCENLTTINFPSSLKTIGSGAFYGCRALSSAAIPNGVTNINSRTFYGCSSLNFLSIPNSVTSIEESAFAGCSALPSITIPNNVTTIGNSTFSGCSGLTSVTIGNSVTSIGNGAFSGCSGLTSVNIPNSVTSIGSSTFYGCSRMTSVIIGNSVMSIGSSAFSGCSGLTSITIPNSVTSIGEGAFYNCSGLTSVTVKSGNVVYDSRDNCNAIIETASNKLIAGSFKTIIPNSVTSIGNGAFFGCSGLTSVTIPNSVTSIGSYAFDGCLGLTSVKVESTKPMSIGSSTFSNRTNAILYVPYGCKAVYEAANYWKDFKEIVEMPSLTLNDQNICKGGKIRLPVLMNNEEEITAFQFDVDVPDGITVIDVQLGDRKSDSHTVDFNKQADGSYRVIVVSLQKVPFSSNEGELVSLMLSADKDIESGDYSIGIKNIVLTTPSKEKFYLADVNSVLSVLNIRQGDADSDGYVDVADVVAMIDYVLDSSTSDIMFLAADMNADGDIDIFDVMIAINIILNRDNSAGSRTRASSYMEEQAVVTAAADGIMLGVNDAGRFTAFQFDIEVADGMELTEVRLNDNTGNHELYSMNIGQNTYRVIGVSMDNSTLTASGNDLIELSFSKGGHAQISNIVFVTPQKSKVYFASDNSEVTGISRIGYKQAEDIYDLSGRKVNTDRSRLPKGLYIINNKKVVIK